jgi:hypothetical protein
MLSWAEPKHKLSGWNLLFFLSIPVAVLSDSLHEGIREFAANARL